jgi:hypothetical protein
MAYRFHRSRDKIRRGSLRVRQESKRDNLADFVKHLAGTVITATWPKIWPISYKDMSNREHSMLIMLESV